MSNKGTKVSTETGQGNGADTEEVLSPRARHRAKNHTSKQSQNGVGKNKAAASVALTERRGWGG